MKFPTKLLLSGLLLLSASFARAQMYKTPLLESLPSSQYVIFLDFDGQNVRSQYWNGGIRIQAEASNATENDIRQTWIVVSEDYSPFNINVTTDSTVFHRAAKGKRVRCIFTPTSAWAFVNGPTGVANQSSFTIATEDVPCWAFNSVGRNAGEIASHEIGHTMGLQHDGRLIPGGNFEPYFPGQNKWGSIMSGSFSSSMLTQWSKGEYNNATNTEDDLAVIGSAFNGFGFRADEVGNTTATAKALVLDAHGTLDKTNAGIITDRTDIDVYKFTTTGGKIMLFADGTPIVTANYNDPAKTSNININMKLIDSNGNVVVDANDPSTQTASIVTTIAAGTYYLAIDGIGYLDPAVDGYSDYGSVGQYFLSGTIPLGTNQAPIVRFSGSPRQHASFNGFMLSPYAEAWDADGTVTTVDYYNYDTLLTGGFTYPLSQLDWTYTSPGTYRITAKIYDDQGAMTESVPLYLEYVVPEVTVTAPADQSVYTEGSTINMAVSARTHSKFVITSVEFFDGTTLLSTDNTAPYTFSWTNVPAGKHTIYARAWSGTVGGWSIGTPVTVTPTAPTTFTASTDTPCAGATGVSYSIATVAFDYTYEWEYSGTGFTITSGDGTNSIVASFSAGATAGTLSVRSVVNGAKSTKLSKALTIAPLPLTPGTISGNSSPGSSTNANAYSVTPIANTTYQWTYSGTGATIHPSGATASIDFSGSATSGTLSVTATNSCGTSTASTLPLTITLPPPPAPTSFTTSSADVCASATSIAYSVPSESGVTYIWQYSGTGFTIATGDGTNAITANFSASATAGTLSVKAQKNNLTSAPLSMQVNILQIPATPGTITGNNSPLTGSSSNAYSVVSVNGVTYQWSYSRTDATLTSNGANANLDFSATAQPGILSVTASNSCGVSQASTLSVNVTTTPVAPATPVFSNVVSEVCKGATGIVYSVIAEAGATYTWTYSGSGFTIASGDGTHSISANFSASATSGTLSVVAKKNGLSSSPLTASIGVSGVPTSPGVISGSASPHAGSSANAYSVNNVSGVTYQWNYNRTDATLTQNGATANLEFSPSAQPGALSVTATNSCGTSAASGLTINVLPVSALPDAPVFEVFQSTVCQGVSGITYRVTAESGARYIWAYSGSGLAITDGANTNSITVKFSGGATSGILSVKSERNGNRSSAAEVSITVKPGLLPPGQISGNISPDAGTSEVYSVVAVSGIDYEWTFTQPDVVVNATGNTATLTFSPSTLPGLLLVVAKTSCGTSTPSSLAIDVQSPVTGIEQEAQSLQAYPNPSTGKFSLSVPGVKAGDVVSITDALGRVVFKSTAGNEMNIDLTDAGKGVYYLRVSATGKMSMTKIVVK